EPHHVRIDRVPGEPDREKAGVSRVFDVFLDTPTYLFVRGDESHPDRTRPLPPGVPAVLGGELEITPVPLPQAAYCPDKQDFIVREPLAAAAADVTRAHHALATAEQAAAGRVALPPPNVPALAVHVALARRAAAEAELARLEVPLAGARQEALEAVVR